MDARMRASLFSPKSLKEGAMSKRWLRMKGMDSRTVARVPERPETSMIFSMVFAAVGRRARLKKLGSCLKVLTASLIYKETGCNKPESAQEQRTVRAKILVYTPLRELFWAANP